VIRHREVRVGDRAVDVIEPEGSFTSSGAGGQLEEFARLVTRLLARGHADIRVGCGEITAFDEMTLSLLVASAMRATAHDSRFALDLQGNEHLRQSLLAMGVQFGDDSDPGDDAAGSRSPLVPPSEGTPLAARRPMPGSEEDDG
jgi:hypothetical protein